MIHVVSLSRRAEARYGVLPYREFREANPDSQGGAMVEMKKPAEHRGD
jgi:hypothetical protein